MISASSITMRYGKRALFENVSVKFRAGHRYGLIGANGSGKSTFMKILADQLEQSSGEVAIDQGCTMGYLRQDHDAFDEFTILDTVYQGNKKLWDTHMEREDLYSKTDLTDEEADRIGDIEDDFGAVGGYTMEADAARLLIGLGFPEELHNNPMGTLQGGWKLRVLLAQVLFGQPDILLLDEPTNHLDMSSRDWLEEFLCRYEGTLIVISHDRYFLNKVCTHTADLDYQVIRMFTGNYDDFMETNAMLLEKRQRENKAQEKRANELRDFINRFSANASKAKQATSRQKELDKLDLDKIKPSSRVAPYIRFESRNRLGDRVIDTEGAAVRFDDLTVFENLDLHIGNGDRIAIIGTNGAGKTTLLKTLIGKLKPTEGEVQFGETAEITYFPQEPMEVLDPNRTAVDWLSGFATDADAGETEVRSAMGRMLFKGDDALKKLGVLSGGEKARMILSMMLMQGGNVIALDEPTNHLDLESIEALNYALGLVEDTLIFVSHDREFINSLATRIIEIDDGKITDYPGNLTDFDAWKAKKKREAKKARNG